MLSFLRYLWARLDGRVTLFSVILILPGIILGEIGQYEKPWINLLSIVALGLSGFSIIKSAVKSIAIDHAININVLMTVACIGAIFIEAYTEAGVVMVLFALGEALEGYADLRVRNSIRSMMTIIPQKATLLNSSHHVSKVINVDELKVGDVVLVRPGEQIPTDGRLIVGVSTVNQSAITGESQWVERKPGDLVFAGSINGEGVLKVEVTNLASENTIARMMRLVEQAQAKKAKTQRFIDRFAAYYTPIIVGLSLFVSFFPPLVFDQPFLSSESVGNGWLYRGLTLLVIGCPCALVLSTPISIVSALSNVAKKGVLVKGGDVLEDLSQVKAIAFDKTGTLTAGKPSVIDVHSGLDLREHDQYCDNGNIEHGVCPDCLVALAGAVEQYSEHPYAEAIIQEATRRGVRDRFPSAEMVAAIRGQGVNGRVAGYEVIVGSHPYFEENVPHNVEVCNLAIADAERGFTPIMVGANGKYVGSITISDQVRETSEETVLGIKKLGIQALVVLSGDNPGVAQEVARRVGISDVRAGLLPEEKIREIQKLQHTYGKVAMVGDGINDTPALATADVGVAIGAAMGGTDQAIETGDVILMGDDLRLLPFTIKLSRRTMRVIRMNVALALLVKFIFLTLTLLGLGSMWLAVFADTGVLLLVSLHGMSLAYHPQNQ